VDELRALNPSLLRSVTPPDAAFDLHLPAGTALLYEKRIAAVPENKRNAWRYHRVTGDDTLASVARESHISVSDLAEANQLKESDSLTGLEGVAVPAAPAPTVSMRALSYTARKGDTLVTIADRFGVSLTQLRQWNKLSGIKVEPGRKLRVTEPVATGHSSRGKRHGKSSSAQSDEPASKSTTKSGKHASSNEKKQSKDASAAAEKKSDKRAKSSASSEGKSTSHRSGKRAKSPSKKEK
jgi:membrane-bound lytic murein transglycosylase D